MVHFFTVLIESDSDTESLRVAAEQALRCFSDRVLVYEVPDDDDAEDATDEGLDALELEFYDFGEAGDGTAEEAETDDGL